MCLLRINLPNLCPNMNHFDAVDFSECHSEKVISMLSLLHLTIWVNNSPLGAVKLTAKWMRS